MNARLHDSVAAPRSVPGAAVAEHPDTARLRKLALLMERGDWTVIPNSASAQAGGGFAGNTPRDLASLRAALDRSAPLGFGGVW